MSLTCYECGEIGHMAKDCPVKTFIDGNGSGWCGSCDERTRLVDLGDKMARCRECHPRRGQLPAQFLRCPSCHEIIYIWDHQECARHQPVSRQLEHVSVPAREPERRDLRTLAAMQVTEARLARMIT